MMDNKDVVKRTIKYLKKYKTVDLKWFIHDSKYGLDLVKNAREIDIVYQALLDRPGIEPYQGHNPDDISLKYSLRKEFYFYVNMFGGIIGLIGGLLGIIAFFRT